MGMQPTKIDTMLCDLQDGENLILRQSGTMCSGDRRHIYSADMRREVCLQFYPDGFEWVDSEPLALSLGYSSHTVGYFLCSDFTACILGEDLDCLDKTLL